MGKLVGSIFLPPPSWIGLMGLRVKVNRIFQLQISWYRCALEWFKIVRLVHTWKLPSVLKIFRCSDLNIPSNWLYVIDIIIRFVLTNRNSENYKLLEKHQTTFTMLWSYTCVSLHVTYAYLRLVLRRASVWGVFLNCNKRHSKKSGLKSYFSLSQVSYLFSFSRCLKLILLCVVFYCFSLLLLILFTILCLFIF